MPNLIEPAKIHFNSAGMPISDSFDDIYFSNQDGAAESRHVFLRGNYLPARFAHWSTETSFVIAETGFGSGLNMLLAAHEFLALAPSMATLNLVSFERYPLQSADISQALQHWPELNDLCASLVHQYPPLINGVHRLQLHPRVTLDLHFGDVLDTLPAWVAANPAKVHAWFLDGFAPSKNPDMWQAELYQAMASAAAETCTLATFTAVGEVRRGLMAAGFAMRKDAGFGRKRDMLVGHRVSPQSPPPRFVNHSRTRRIAVVGGGIAAASLLRLLSEHSLHNRPELHLFCRDSSPAQGASGNAQGAVYPLLQADFTPTVQFYAQAFSFARNCYQRWAPEYCHWSGMLQLGFNQKMQHRQQQTMIRTDYPPSFVRAVDAEQATTMSGVQCQQGGLYYPSSGWVEPKALVDKLIADSQAQVHCAHEVISIERVGSLWRLQGSREQQNESNSPAWEFLADDVVLANGADLHAFSHQRLVIRPAGGQVTQVASTAASGALKTVLCHKGYLTPAHNERHCVGATFSKLAPEGIDCYVQDEQSVAEDSHSNIELNERYSGLQFSADNIIAARRSVRATTPNHLPVVGAHPAYVQQAAGVWVLGGLGSRGFTSAPWCAQWLVDQIFSQVEAIDSRVAKSLDTQRFSQ
ncbi:MAG: FAD-dependent 5-carboxymethylaminomethyl-2-thiouridine(34) oxidoreductase MnmC [Idiomarina sp.]|nr:FAD-dependent 5-carboxymethylaminomethyl-2-thiouridine(34) oxidoreductase MnmC [Idiomarina sp.]